MSRPNDASRSPDAHDVGSVLDGLLAGRQWRSGLRLGRLAAAWAEVVGERLAEESAPIRLDEGGVLVVRASSAGWAAQVGFLRREIREGANRTLRSEGVKEVRVVVDPGPPTA